MNISQISVSGNVSWNNLSSALPGASGSATSSSPSNGILLNSLGVAATGGGYNIAVVGFTAITTSGGAFTCRLVCDDGASEWETANLPTSPDLRYTTVTIPATDFTTAQYTSSGFGVEAYFSKNGAAPISLDIMNITLY